VVDKLTIQAIYRSVRAFGEDAWNDNARLKAEGQRRWQAAADALGDVQSAHGQTRLVPAARAWAIYGPGAAMNAPLIPPADATSRAANSGTIAPTIIVPVAVTAEPGLSL
jgi:hypothetical protein